MHIAEGVLAPSVLLVGGLGAAAGVAAGLRKTDPDDVVRVAVVSSALFVASLIHVPIGAVSVHLVLNGLAGLVLGWAVFPALLVALLLEAVLFGFGGLTTLGVNTLNMALPAVLCYYLYCAAFRRRAAGHAFAGGFAVGALSIALTGVMVSASMLATGREFLPLVLGILAAHVPVMLIEGCVTGAAVVFISRVRPELLACGTHGGARPPAPLPPTTDEQKV